MRQSASIETVLQEGTSGTFFDAIFFEPDLKEEANYGKLCMSVSLNMHATSAEALVSSLLDTFKKSYYKDLSKDPYRAFEQTLVEINSLVKTRLSDSEIKQASIALSIIAKGELHVSVTGNASLSLSRKNDLIPVTTGLASDEDPERPFLQIASGGLKEGDSIFVSTSDLESLVDTQTILQHLESGFKGVASKIKQSLSAKEELCLLAIHLPTSKQASSIPTSKSFHEQPPVNPLPKKSTQLKNQLARLFNLKKAYQSPYLDTSSMPALKPQGGPLKRMASFASSLTGKKPLPSLSNLKPRLTTPTDKQRKQALVIVSLIVFVVLSVIVISVERNISSKREALVSSFNSIVEDRKTAETRRLFNKEGARKLLQAALETATVLEAEGFDLDKIETERVKIFLLLDEINNVARIHEPRVLSDISQDFPSSTPKGLLSLKGDLFTFDDQTVFKLILDEVENYPITDEGIHLATPFHETGGLLFLTLNGNLYQYKDGELSLMENPDATWNTPVDLEEYKDSKNIYALDPGNNEIWAYSFAGSGFRGATRKNKQGYNLKNAVSIAIDGSIYVLKDDNTVIKTYGGESRRFEFTNLPDTLKNPSQIYTSAASTHVYFLYPEQNSIVSTTKQGKYLKQYKVESPLVTTLEDIYVVEEANKLFAVDQSGKIFEIGL